jgi:LmbE family N-acetylglucosaminyl deacetylase
MKKQVIVVAPHPDDETLGCGGAIIKHKEQGDEIYWLLVTAMNENQGFSKTTLTTRREQIIKVAELYKFNGVYELNFPTTMLDRVPTGELISAMSDTFTKIKPNTVYLPYSGDIHSDHKVVFHAGLACTKWFRYPSVQRILAYETLSETDFCGDLDSNGFRPNVYMDISNYLEKKLVIAAVYESEMAVFPFPRSEEAIRALAKVRGAACGCQAAEAFMLIKEII